MYSMNSPGATADGGRNEKLLAARKKLKQFQNRRRSTSRNDSSGRGNDENRGDANDDHGGRHRSQHRQSGDEGDDRPLSECYPGYSTESLAESTASTTKATKASRAARRASAASSRYLETPEPIRISIAPEHHQEILRQQQERQAGPIAFYHDEQRSPFQRVKRESESSEATLQPISRPIDPQAQHVSLSNEFSLGSSSSAEAENGQRHQHWSPPPDIGISGTNNMNVLNASSAVAVSDVSLRSGHQSGDEQFVLNMDETASENSHVPPISSVNESLLQYAPVAGLTTAGVQEVPLSMDQTTTQMIPASYAHVASGTEDQYVQNSSLQATVQQQQAVVEQLTAQLQQLNAHYTQLHTAYSDLVQQQQTPVTTDDKTRETEELRRQLQLHLHTMSVLVDEKTDLQSQLRQAMEIANKKHLENEELHGRLKANRDRLTAVENELESHGGSYRNLEDTLKRQAVELERLRKESAQWQARTSEAQQDRSEMNAKLKVRSREVDDLSGKLKEAEKQLHLREIYIQQITGGPGALQQQQALGEELEQQRRANSDLAAQLESARKANEQWRWESEQSRERYEAYVKQLNEGATSLSQRLEMAEREKYTLQLRCEQVEKQLAAVDAEKGQDGARPTTEDLESLKMILNEFEQGLKAANDRAAALERQLVEKETTMRNMTEQLGERDRLVHQLSDQLNEKYQHDDSAKSLLEQLHNEKATVSRAVAQNIELKKQLVELQEKFVAMTESNMETVDKLQSTERQLVSMKEAYDHKDDDTKALLETRENEIATLRGQLNALASQNFERSHLEDRLRHYEAVQKHFDAELERSQREISHLKVENADLTQRLTILNDANKNLQMERQRSVQQVSEREHNNVSAEADEVAKLRAALIESENTTKALAHQVEELNQQSNEEIKRQLASYEQELADTRRRLQHLTTENAELHRIMEQNAEDENQNTIRVELHQALNRSMALSSDNERLRQRVQELEVQMAQDRSTKSSEERSSVGAIEAVYREEVGQSEHLHGTCSHASLRPHHHENNGDDRSSVCSEHIEQRREATNSEAFEHVKAAMEQLQQRFAKAMNENADLSDQNQQLEHLITQLQSETETIGEYITIYQHQRRTIRERLREKEEYVAKLAKEKEDVQEKLTELQQLVVRLLRERGSLRQYPQTKPVYGKPPPSSPSVVPRKPRGLSETLVDEVSGAEFPLVPADGSDGLSPSAIPDTPIDPVQSNGDISPAMSEEFRIRSTSLNHAEAVAIDVQQRRSRANSVTDGAAVALPDLDEGEATAERILRLLTEMRRPDLVNSLPPVDRSLHCKYCTGRLIML